MVPASKFFKQWSLANHFLEYLSLSVPLEEEKSKYPIQGLIPEELPIHPPWNLTTEQPVSVEIKLLQEISPQFFVP